MNEITQKYTQKSYSEQTGVKTDPQQRTIYVTKRPTYWFCKQKRHPGFHYWDYYPGALSLIMALSLIK